MISIATARLRPSRWPMCVVHESWTAPSVEPNAIAILARGVVAEMEAAGHWAAMPYRLSWSLSPVSFFTTKQLQGHGMVNALRDAVVEFARRMQQTTW